MFVLWRDRSDDSFFRMRHVDTRQISGIVGAIIGIVASFTVNCTLVEISINGFFAVVHLQSSSFLTFRPFALCTDLDSRVVAHRA